MNPSHDSAAGHGAPKSAFGPTSAGSRSLSDQAGRVRDEAHELGRAALAEASDMATKLREKGEDALDAGRETAERAKGALECAIADNPMKSVLIALGIGAVIAYCVLPSRE